MCATETKTRCSPCAKAGIDIFFCSPAHQKLSQILHATEPTHVQGRPVEMTAVNIRIAEYRLVRSNTAAADLFTLPSPVPPLMYFTQVADVSGVFDLSAAWLPGFFHRLSAVSLLVRQASAPTPLESNDAHLLLLSAHDHLSAYVEKEVKFARELNDLAAEEVVWFAHRLFCGPGKADPPAIPELSPEEIASARARRDAPLNSATFADGKFTLHAAGQGHTLATHLATVERLPFELVMHHIGGPVNDCTVLQRKPLLVAIVRSTAYADPACQAKLASDNVSLNFAIDHTSRLFVRIGAVLAHKHIVTETVNLLQTGWWTPLLHRLLILSAVLAKAIGTNDLAVKAHTHSARWRLQKWLEGGMGTEDARLKTALSGVNHSTAELDQICRPLEEAMNGITSLLLGGL
ncbi:hypothetical protein JCM10296v2_003342 [Rhodotorula toruloides]